jgi:hypothetical protein
VGAASLGKMLAATVSDPQLAIEKGGRREGVVDAMVCHPVVKDADAAEDGCQVRCALDD